MPKVCFLLGTFQINGGIGRVTSILANELSSIDGFEVSTIEYTHRPDKPMLYDLDKRIERLSLYSAQISMRKAILLKHAVRKVRSILRKGDIDILIACGALFYPLGIAAVIGLKTKCYCWEHISPSIGNDYRFQRFARLIGIKRADALIVLTKSAERYYIEKLHASPDKVVQIYNPAVEPTGLPPYNENSRKLITVGRLCEQKNYTALIEIARRVLPANPDWCWDIYGEGELREEIATRIQAAGLANRVVLQGQVDNLYDRYNDYAVLVMTSRYEGFPMALLEGAANALPLLSFDIDTGPNEIIRDGENGFLVEFEDIDTMSEKLSMLMNDGTLRVRMSAASFETSQSFSLDECVKRWVEMLCK